MSMLNWWTFVMLRSERVLGQGPGSLMLIKTLTLAHIEKATVDEAGKQGIT